MPSCLIPGDGIQKLLHDPFGWQALIYQEKYENPNRFFCHWTMYHYYHTAMGICRQFADPVTSIYWCTAFAKTLFQCCIVVLLARLVAYRQKFWSLDTWMAKALIFPLIQNHGYYATFGVIDSSPTYAFFYAYPTALLLFMIYGFIRCKGQDFSNTASPWLPMIMYVLIPVVCLSGPLNPGICILLMGAYILYIARQKQLLQPRHLQQRLQYLFHEFKYKQPILWLTILGIFSIYALYLGRFNSLEERSVITLKEMYHRYPDALEFIFTSEPSYVLVLSTLCLNFLLIHFSTIKQASLHRRITYSAFAFCLIYIFLLPLGGYRVYRPLILRYDTIIPVNLCFMLLFAQSTLMLLHRLKRISRMVYVVIPAVFLSIFMMADISDLDENNFERKALQAIMKHPNKTIRLRESCRVVSWSVITDPNASQWSMEMLRKLNITIGTGTYYYTPDSLSHP